MYQTQPICGGKEFKHLCGKGMNPSKIERHIAHSKLLPAQDTKLWPVSPPTFDGKAGKHNVGGVVQFQHA